MSVLWPCSRALHVITDLFITIQRGHVTLLSRFDNPSCVTVSTRFASWAYYFNNLPRMMIMFSIFLQRPQIHIYRRISSEYVFFLGE